MESRFTSPVAAKRNPYTREAQLVGRVGVKAWRKAATMLRVPSVKMEYCMIEGRLILCYVEA